MRNRDIVGGHTNKERPDYLVVLQLHNRFFLKNNLDDILSIHISATTLAVIQLVVSTLSFFLKLLHDSK